MRKRRATVAIAIVLAAACEGAPLNVVSTPSAITPPAPSRSITTPPPPPRTPLPAGTTTASARPSTPVPTPQGTAPPPRPTISPSSCHVTEPQLRFWYDGPNGDCSEEVALVPGGRFIFSVTAVHQGDPRLGYGEVDDVLSVRVRGSTGGPLWSTALHQTGDSGGYFGGISTFIPAGQGNVHIIYYETSHGASCCGFDGGIVAVAPDGFVREVLSVHDSYVRATPCGTVEVTGPARYSPGAQAEFHFDEEYRWGGSGYVLIGQRFTPPPAAWATDLPLSCDPATGKEFVPASCLVPARYIGVGLGGCTTLVAVLPGGVLTFLSTTDIDRSGGAHQTIAISSGSPWWSIVLDRGSAGDGTYLRDIATYHPAAAEADHLVYRTELHGASCCTAAGGVVGRAPNGAIRELLTIDNGGMEITHCGTILATGPTGGSGSILSDPHYEREYRWSGSEYVLVRERLTPSLFGIGGPNPTPAPLSCDP